jgi:hypothetical protein
VFFVKEQTDRGQGWVYRIRIALISAVATEGVQVSVWCSARIGNGLGANGTRRVSKHFMSVLAAHQLRKGDSRPPTPDVTLHSQAFQARHLQFMDPSPFETGASFRLFARLSCSWCCPCSASPENMQWHPHSHSHSRARALSPSLSVCLCVCARARACTSATIQQITS